MGYFDVHCVASDLALRGETVFIPIIRANDTWVPCGLPWQDEYDRLGGLDDVLLDSVTSSLFDEAELPPSDEDDDSIPHRLWQAHGRWKGHELSYTLVDAGIYHAIARTVALGGKPGITGYDPESMSKRLWKELIKQTFPVPDVRKLFKHWDEELRAPLVELSRFRAWGTVLRPAHEGRAGQYGGLTPRKKSELGDTTLPRVEAARQRYAAFPLVLRAVAENARRWAENDSVRPDLSWADHLPVLETGPLEGDVDPDGGPRYRFAREPGHLGVEWLLVRRSFQGEQVIELHCSDLDRIVSRVRERLTDRAEGFVLEGRGWAIRFEPAETPAFELDSLTEVLSVKVSPGLARELLSALGELASQGSGAVELPSLPGLQFRV